MSNNCFLLTNFFSLFLSFSFSQGVSDRHWPKIQSVLPLFAQSLQWKDEEILKDVCWSLSYIRFVGCY